MIHLMMTGPVKQILLGPALSIVNKRIVPFVDFLAVPQVSNCYIYYSVPVKKVSNPALFFKNNFQLFPF